MHFPLRFYIQKSRHFAKSKTICVTFLYTKIWTLCVTQFFIEFLKLAEEGSIFICKKQCTLRYILYVKNNALSVTFLYLKFIVYSTDAYLLNERTIRAIRSKNKSELFIENWSYSYIEGDYSTKHHPPIYHEAKSANPYLV